MKFLICLTFLFLSLHLESREIVIHSSQENSLSVEITSETKIGDILELVSKEDLQHGIFLEITKASTSKPTENIIRNYSTPVTLLEKQDISYIVNTLGMSSLSKITKAKSSLKKAGNRIDNVHPLRFLLCVFTDEQMKASVHAMEGRSWVWTEFLSGLKKSLEEESQKDNMKMEFITDFASRLGITVDLIYPSISQHQWNQLVSILIDKIPRNSDADRYNM